MPARSARSSARTPGLFDATASISACRFVPSPDTSTPIIGAPTECEAFRGEGSRPYDPPDHELAVPRLCDHRAEADAEVEDAAQLVLVDVAREPVEDGRALPGIPVELGAQAVRDRPREIALDAAAG